MRPKITIKYLVADEEGPIRAFYSLSEARRFSGPGRTITEIREARYEPSRPSYEDVLKRTGEALW